MRKLLVIPALLGGLFLTMPKAEAHCDAIDGPVATAALDALESSNVNLVLPYAPETAESEIGAVFNQALAVRAGGGEAKELADRYFIETVVRLHRAGEGAAYTGLKPAGLDFGPAIPAAERAIESGDLSNVAALLEAELEHGLESRFAHVLETRDAPAEPQAAADVPAGRERVSAELGFIAYVEGLRQTIHGAPGTEHRE